MKAVKKIKFLNCLLKRKLFDWSYIPNISHVIALYYFLLYKLFKLFKRRRALMFLKNSHHRMMMGKNPDANTTGLFKTIEKTIIDELIKKKYVYKYVPDQSNTGKKLNLTLLKPGCLVLKSPRFNGDKVIEKGIILLKFTENILSIDYCTNINLMLKDYTMVIEPGWSSYALFLDRLLKFSGHPVVIMASEKHDFNFLKRINTNLIPISMGPGDWANPRIFHPVAGSEKVYDAVMVSRWNTFKRHHILFRAIKKLNDPDFKVALISNSSDNRKEIELLVEGYGVQNNIKIFERLTQQGVNKIFSQSKVNLLLSLQEGGNRSLFEGFMSDVPGIALKNNIGIPKNYFNAETGKLIEEKDLSSELLYFREQRARFNPRKWAMANITPEISSAKLNRMLKELALLNGEEWTKDIAAKCNSPNLEYYPDKLCGQALPSILDVIVQYARSDEIRKQIIDLELYLENKKE